MTATSPIASFDRASLFVGRTAELERLHTALAQTAAGSGRVVMLVGEAGIGKTRTAAEFAAQARAAGALVLRGGCYEGEWAPPYGPFVEALTAYVRAADPAQLREELGFGAAPLTRVLPAIRERLADVPEPTALRPDEELFRVLDAVSQFFIAMSARQPAVLLLDDLHWADKGTIALLRHVARFAPEHRLLLVGAYRHEEIDATHPLADLLGVLRREATFERVPLKGLDQEGTETLVAALAHSEVAAGIVSDIHRRTQGNPFFIRETVQHLIEEERLTYEQAPLPDLTVSEGIRHVIERRLTRLSADAQRLLTVASAFDGPFRYDVAAAAAALDADVALATIDHTLQSQLITSTTHADTYDFGHALVRHTLYTSLSSSRRVRLHRQLASAMERVYGERLEEHAGEIAQQYYRSKDLPHAERAVTYALLAAGRAETAYAHDDAVKFLRMAVELSPENDARRTRTLARLGMALGWGLNFAEALSAMRTAGDLIALAEGRDAAADYLAEAAMTLWAAGSQQGGWALARLGLGYIGERRDITWVRLLANDIIRQEADNAEHPGVIIETPERRTLTEVTERLSFSRWEEIALGMYGFLPIRSRHDILRRSSTSPFWLSIAGEYRRSVPVWEDLLDQSQREGRLGDVVAYLAMLARIHNAQGAFAAARAAYDRAATLAERLTGSFFLTLTLGATRFEIQTFSDEGWEKFQLVAEGETPSQIPTVLLPLGAAVGARVSARLGRTTDATSLLGSLVVPLERAPATNHNTLMASEAATVLWLLGSTAHIRVIEQNLREKVLVSDIRSFTHDARLSMAHVSALQGRYDEAVEWFARARVVLDEQGARPLRAIVDYDEALMYARRGDMGDRERAVPLLEAALPQFRVIGMPGWIRRAEHLLAHGREWTPENRDQGIEGSRDRVESQSGTGNRELGTGDRQPGTRDPRPGTKTPEPATCLMRCEGDVWSITFGNATHRIKDSRGLRYLALLFAHPGREFHASELVALSNASAATERRRNSDELRITDLGDAGAVLDATATAQYKQRLDSLREELHEAEANNDLGRSERLRHELDLLVSSLSGAQRGRRAVSHAERARSAVSKRIRAALKQISEVDPKLGRNLNLTVHTGTFCSYRPAPALQIETQP